MISTWLRRARRDDSGFTLPELIVSIVVLAFIMGAIGLTLVVVLKNSNAAADRVTAGGGAQTLSAWFPGDVQSAQAVGGGDSRPGTSSGCGDDQLTENVVTLRRADGSGDLVSYRLKDVGNGELQLWRVTCIARTWHRNIIVQGITDKTLVKVTGTDRAGVALPAEFTDANTIGTLALQASVGRNDAVQLLVSGTPRTPGLPTPCSLLSGGPQSVQLDTNDTLTDAVTFTLNTSGACGGATVPQLAIETGRTTLTLDLEGGPNTWTVVVPPGPRWRDGVHDATLLKDGSPSGSFTVDALPQPCRITSMSPDQLELESNRRLRDDQPIQLALSGGCGNIAISIGDVDPAINRTAVTRRGGYEFTLRRQDGPWGDTASVEVFSNGTSIGFATLHFTDGPCRIVGGTPVVLVTEAEPRVLRGPLAETGFQVFTTGTCASPLVAHVPVNDTDVADVPLAESGPATWQGTLTAAGWTLTPPPKTVVVTSAGLPVADPFPLAVSDCALVDGSGNPTVRLDDGHDRLANGQKLTFTTTGSCGPLMSVTFRPPGNGAQQRPAQDIGGGSGSTRRWEVDLPDQLDWNRGGQPVTVTVFNSDPADPAAFAGTWQVSAV